MGVGKMERSAKGSDGDGAARCKSGLEAEQPLARTLSGLNESPDHHTQRRRREARGFEMQEGGVYFHYLQPVQPVQRGQMKGRVSQTPWAQWGFWPGEGKYRASRTCICWCIPLHFAACRMMRALKRAAAHIDVAPHAATLAGLPS